MNVIYLDIDGVLNTTSFNTKETAPSGFTGIYDSKLKILKEIVVATSAKIVLSSTWRDVWEKDYNKCGQDGKYLTDRFAKFNLEIFDKLDGVSTERRGHEILSYVNKNNIKNWIVIDDEIFPDFKECGINDFGDTPRLILVGSKNGGGLKPKHVKLAKRRMYNIKRKGKLNLCDYCQLLCYDSWACCERWFEDIDNKT